MNTIIVFKSSLVLMTEIELKSSTLSLQIFTISTSAPFQVKLMTEKNMFFLPFFFYSH